MSLVETVARTRFGPQPATSANPAGARNPAIAVSDQRYDRATLWSCASQPGRESSPVWNDTSR